MKHHQAVLVLSGYNIRAVIAFCRWATAHQVNYHIIAINDDDPIFLTKYKSRVSITRKASALLLENFLSWIKEIRKQYSYERVLILPSSEFLNRFLLAHRNQIEAVNCIIPLVESRLYASISDKYAFAELCSSFGLDIPAEYSDMPGRLPFVAKPRTYCAKDGRQLVPHLINTDYDRAAFCKAEDAGDYFFQRFVQGESHYLLAYISKQETDVIFCQENLMQQAHGGSIILARASTFDQTEIAQRYIEMLHNIKYSGLIMIELRLDKSSGRYCMIEANPRLWGPMQFSVDNNIDHFGALLRDYGFEVMKINDVPLQAEFYFWSGGITQKAQSIAYHHYSNEQFVKDLPMLKLQDIFSRNDTHNLFEAELSAESLK